MPIELLGRREAPAEVESRYRPSIIHASSGIGASLASTRKTGTIGQPKGSGGVSRPSLGKMEYRDRETPPDPVKA